MKKFTLPLVMAFALAGFAPAFADTGTAPTPAPGEQINPSDPGAAPTAPKSDEKKKDEKGSTGTTTEPAPAPAPDAK